MIPVSLAFGLALVVGAVLGTAARQILGRRTHLGWAASVLSGITGAFLGTALVEVVMRDDDGGLHPAASLLASVGGTVLVLAIATRMSAPPPPEAAALVAGGERSDVEFKSTARFNLHTGKRDERIELVVGKTVAALANTDGGHLLIGVADDGTVLGLDDDLGLMKKPDVDRFELWLRDYLTQTLGGAAATSAVVRFPSIDGREICWVAIPPSTRPVYLVPGKSQPPQLWVRVGNSTRQLPLDEALAYASDRWGRRRLRSARN